jgi:hypothetical protein
MTKNKGKMIFIRLERRRKETLEKLFRGKKILL